VPTELEPGLPAKGVDGASCIKNAAFHRRIGIHRREQSAQACNSSVEEVVRRPRGPMDKAWVYGT